MQVAIIGGGASGLICAIECAKGGVGVEVFEQNGSCGKKILVSGNGKCNITNRFLHRNDFVAKNPKVVDEVLKQFGYNEQKRFFASLGLLLDEKEDGKVYPYSYEAKSVLDVLLSSAKQYGVKITTEAKVSTIGEDLVIVVNGQKKRFDAVVVASGSSAASHLGGNTSGYEFGRFFGHKVLPVYPALVQLVSSSKYPKMMSGVKIKAEISLFVNGVKEQVQREDLLFTDYGLSGLGVLDISQKASLALQEHGAVDVVVNLLPRWEQSALVKQITDVAKNNPTYTVETILHTLLPLKIVKTLLVFLGIEKNVKQIGTKQVKKIVHTMQQWRFPINKTRGFRYAEVCGGGVSSDEINPKTFESKKKKGLYFIGEVLDVVGRRGGYNFAFAWGSGYLCARSILKACKR